MGSTAGADETEAAIIAKALEEIKKHRLKNTPGN